MSDFIVHSVPGSPFGRAVLAALEEKNTPYRFSLVGLGARNTEPHILRHPFGRVPVVEHEGFILYETQAILRYLDRLLPSPRLTPVVPEAAANMDRAMNINDWYLFNGVNNVIGFQRVVAPRLMGRTPDEEAIAAAMPKAHTVFKELSRLLGTKPYIACESLTLADLMIAPQLDFLAQTPEWVPLSEGHQNLVDWLDRMNARPSFKATTRERLTQLAAAA
jgi:glutathione S-transferase